MKQAAFQGAYLTFQNLEGDEPCIERLQEWTERTSSRAQKHKETRIHSAAEAEVSLST